MSTINDKARPIVIDIREIFAQCKTTVELQEAREFFQDALDIYGTLYENLLKKE